MISSGIAFDPPSIVDRPELQAAQRQRHAERDAEDHDRERPHDVQHVADHAVGPAAEVAGEQAEQHRHQRGDERGAHSDQQRVAPSVEQPHHHVAAVLVGAQEVLLPPRRPDRDRVLGHHVGLLAVDHHGVGGLALGDSALGHVLRPQRRRQRGAHHQQEDDPERDRHPVAPQPAHAQAPRARAGPHVLPRLPADLGRYVEGELGCGIYGQCHRRGVPYLRQSAL